MMDGRMLWVVVALAMIAAGFPTPASHGQLLGGNPPPIPGSATANLVQRHVVTNGLDRSYFAYVPKNSTGNRQLPVVLAFHGGGGSAEGFASDAALQDAAQSVNYVVVYPESYRRTWNEDGYCCGEAARARVDDASFVRTLLDDLERIVPIDRRRVYATGFSNGGGLSYWLACTLSDRIAAIAPMSTGMRVPPSQCHPTHPIAVFALHGLTDPVAPYYGGTSIIQTVGPQPPVQQGIDFWRQFDGTQNIERMREFGGAAECDLYLGGRDGSRVQLCRIPGMGHRWPGSQPTPRSLMVDRYLSGLGMDLGPYGPALDANDAILQFFAGYALPFAPSR
jgi:polyhydroxybutyrate depolymerase